MPAKRETEFFAKLDKACADAWVDKIATHYMSHPRRVRALQNQIEGHKRGIAEQQAFLRDAERELARVLAAEEGGQP